MTVIYDMVIIWHRFSFRFQPWWWLCNLESIWLSYMIWLSSGTVFHFDFNHDGDYVIWRVYDCHIWYSYLLAPFFISISTVIVIMWSGDFLADYMIWASSVSVFHFDFNCDSYYVIRRLFWLITWYGHCLAPFFISISSVIVIMWSGDFLAHYMIWASSGSVFHFDFNCDSYYEPKTACRSHNKCQSWNWNENSIRWCPYHVMSQKVSGSHNNYHRWNRNEKWCQTMPISCNQPK
jgi:hypothetical protein